MVRERPKNKSHVEVNSFLEALTDQQADIKLNKHIEDLLLDNEGELKAEKENLFVFSLNVKKCKQKLKSFLDMKVDSNVQQIVPLPNTENLKVGQNYF